MTFTRKLTTAIATGALLMQSVAGVALAETTISVTGNGSSSNNDVNVTKQSSTVVSQNNVANVTNNVSGNANTGGNDANDNTGGDVAIKTGDAKSNVEISNDLNSNFADVDNCDCEGDAKVTISGNGSYSDNDVDLKLGTKTELFQENKANVSNNVDANAKTGKNDANRNTGGDVTVITGDAKSNVAVSTAANRNVARIGGHGNGSDVEALIEGNGSNSDSEIDLDVARELVLAQKNDADIDNDVDADASTGWNDADDNTGGDVAISTGDAHATVAVDNMVNFNAADIDCDCVTDVKAAVKGNGYDSENKIDAKLANAQELFQENEADLNNDVDSDAKTGKNDVNRNTGDTYASDPLVITGDAHTDHAVSNTGNSNVLGAIPDFDMPDMDLDVDFHEVFWMLWSHMHSN